MMSDPPHSSLPGLAGLPRTSVPAAGAVALIAAAALAGLSVAFDARIAAAVAHLPPWAVTMARLVSDLGRSTYMFALAALAVAGAVAAQSFTRRSETRRLLIAVRERGFYMLGVLAVSGILAQLIKHLVGRARPHLMPALGPYHFDLLSMKASLASFPSGHATTVCAVAAALGLLAPRGRIALFAAAGLVAALRIAVDAHYFSDVVAGGTLGVSSALSVARVCAGWSFAFERDAAAIRLKDAGIVLRRLRGDV